MRPIRRSGRRWHDRGAAAVEMAIVLPLLLLVIGGIVDFGRFFFYEIQVTNAAREGARAAVVNDLDVTQRVLNAAAVPGLTAGNVGIVRDCAAAPPNDNVTVTISDVAFDWILLEPAASMIGAATSLPDTLTAKAVMRCGG